MRRSGYASRGWAVEGPARNPRQLREQESRPAEDVVLPYVAPHPTHAGAAVLRIHGHGAMDGRGDVLHVVGVDQQRVPELVGGPREAAEDQGAVVVVARGHVLLRDEVHAE